MFLVAEVWRGRTRSRTVRLFSELKDAYRYYNSLSTFVAQMWEIDPNTDKPMVPLKSGPKLDKRVKEEENANE